MTQLNRKMNLRVCMLAVLMTVMFAAHAQAATTYAWFYNKIGETKEYYGVERYQDVILTDGHEDLYGKVTVTYSNPKIVSIKKNSKKEFSATVHQEGTFTLTQSFYKKSSDKTPAQSISINYQTVKYASPIKSFKIGKRSLTSRFKKKATFSTYSHYSGRVRVMTKNGWKIKGIYKATWSKSKNRYVLSKKKQGTKIRVRDYQGIVVVLKKGNLTSRVSYFSFYD